VKIAFLLIAIGASFAGCNDKDRKLKGELSQVQLNKDIILFASKAIPRIYSGIVKIDNEIRLIDEELERLLKIESRYPRQQKIVALEKANWKKIQGNLLKELAVLEKNVEEIYVTYMVNKKKGKTLIQEKTEPILSTINDAIKASSPHTRRLKPAPKKSFVAKIKEKFSS
jgi:hypothetical protein